MTKKNIQELESFTNKVRIDILKMVYNAKSGHIGGSMSAADILAVLYNNVMNISSNWSSDPNFEKRDRFILSKGHASPALYATLARTGFFDTDELMTFRKLGSRLQGHPSLKSNLEGIEASTGSLGQGLSMAVGIAMGLKLDKNNAQVYCLTGDGVMQEGSIWEALMNASQRKLDNFILIVDKNNLQIDGSVSDIKCLDPLDKKLEAFGFKTITIDGHNYKEIEDALIQGKNSDVPFAIIANTIKGKGVSFMENNAGWHGKAPNEEDYTRALGELENA